MSVLCTRIPDLPLALAARTQTLPADRPVALVAADERVSSVSPVAALAGLRPGMPLRQARLRCPDLQTVPLDLALCDAAQRSFLAELAQWELPVEPHGLGLAYVDLHTVTTHRAAAHDLAADLGRRLRQTLGADLQPALGWDHSKFCARAAAFHTRAGRIKLVAQADEVSFLAPLPITLLPLPPHDLQRLHWLGITTLGQFAALPAAAVWQQFGKPGQLAQQWAQGRDRRPVQPAAHTAWTPLPVDFATPVDQLAPVVTALLAYLTPHLDRWAADLQGCLALRLDLTFLDHTTHALDLRWVEPVRQPARLAAHLRSQLAAFPWPAALDHMTITQAVTAELPTPQLSLFAEATGDPATPAEVAHTLQGRYGAIFWRGELADAAHPVDERRMALGAL